MKLIIKRGMIEADIDSGSLTVEDVRSMLKKLSEAEEKETVDSVKTASISPHSSKSNMQGKLNAKPKLPI